MLHTLREGDKVKVWPAPGHRVPKGQDTYRPNVKPELPPLVTYAPLLDPAGEVVEWNIWYHEFAKQGSILFSDPGKDGELLRQAIHVRHPDEWVAAKGKPAHELGHDSPEEAAHWYAMDPERFSHLKPEEKKEESPAESEASAPPALPQVEAPAAKTEVEVPAAPHSPSAR